MATVEELLVKIDASTESLRREMRRAEAAVDQGQRKINRSLTDIDGAFGKVGASITKVTRALGPLGAALSVASLASLTNRALSSADALAKTADKLGLTVEGLQELRFAAERSGVSAGTLDMAMQRLTRRLGEAAQGSGELKDTLIQYGIAVRDANGNMRSTEAVLGDLANAIQGADSDAERLRIAFKAFDSEGAALVNTLRGGEAGLEALRAKAREAGVVIGDDVARQAEAARDAIDTLASAVSAQLTTALVIGTARLLEFFGVLSEFDLIAEPVERLAAIEQRITAINAALEDPRTRNRPGLTAELAELTEAAEALRRSLTAGGGAGGGGVTGALDETTDKIEAAIRALEEQVVATDNVVLSLGEESEVLKGMEARQAVLNAARREGVTLTDEQRARVDEMVAALERNLRIAREHTEAEKAATKAREDAARAAEKAAEAQRQYERDLAEFRAEPFLEALRDIQSTITDVFERAFEGSINSLEDFADSFLSILRRLAANIASQAIVVPIVSSVAGGLGLPLGNLGVPTAPGSSSGGGVGLGDVFGLGRSIWGAYSGSTAGIANAFSMSSIGTALGLSYAIPATVGPVAGATIGGGLAIGGYAGGTALTGAGSALAAAAPFLGIAAAALPMILAMTGAFGGPPSVGPTGVGRFTDPFDFDSAVFSTDNGGDASAVRAVGEEITGVLTSVRDSIGASAVAGYGFDIGYFPNPEGGSGRAAGFTLKEIIGAQAADQNLFEGLEADELVFEAVRATLRRGIENVDHDEVATAIRNSTADTLEDLLADIDFAQALGEYVENGLAEPLTGVEQAFDALEESFEDAKQQARDLGLSVDDVTDMFGELRDQLEEQVADDLTARLRSAEGNGFLNQIEGVLDQRALDARNAAAAGLDVNGTAGAIAAANLTNIVSGLSDEQRALAASTFSDAMLEALLAAANDNVDPAADPAADLAGTFAEMRASITDTIAAREAEIDALEETAAAAGRVGRALLATADGLLLDSSLSPLSPEDRLAEARRQYEAVLAATGGDGPDAERAREELNSISRDYLEAAREYYGSSSDYNAVFERVQEDLRAVGRAQLDVERAQLAALRTIADSITDLQAALSGGESAAAAFGTSYTVGGDGQAVSNTGFDLGYQPEVALAILGALSAAGLSTPSGFGEGQLTALRHADARVHALVSGLGFADGGVFAGGNVIPSATGGVISRPTHFPIGLMGEAGPEAIMPLERGADGRLGVVANSDSRAMVAQLERMNARLEAIEANTGSTARSAQLERARPRAAGGNVR